MKVLRPTVHEILAELEKGNGNTKIFWPLVWLTKRHPHIKNEIYSSINSKDMTKSLKPEEEKKIEFFEFFGLHWTHIPNMEVIRQTVCEAIAKLETGN